MVSRHHCMGLSTGGLHERNARLFWEVICNDLGEQGRENDSLSSPWAGPENTHWEVLKVRKTVKAKHRRKTGRRGKKEIINLIRSESDQHSQGHRYGKATWWFLQGRTQEVGSLLLVHLCVGGSISTMLLFMLLLHASTGMLVHQQAGATKAPFSRPTSIHVFFVIKHFKILKRFVG